MDTSMKTLFLVLFLLFITCANCNHEEEVLECTKKLETVYQTPDPVDNIWHGLINLRENMFVGQNPIPDEVKGYYLHLLNILEDHVHLTVVSPIDYCNAASSSSNLRPNEDSPRVDPRMLKMSTFQWCLDALVKIGCTRQVNSGFQCFKNIYINHVLSDITVENVFPNWTQTIPSEFRDNMRYLEEHKISYHWQKGHKRKNIVSNNPRKLFCIHFSTNKSNNSNFLTTLNRNQELQIGTPVCYKSYKSILN